LFLFSGAGAAVLTLGMTSGVITTRQRLSSRLVQKIAFALIALSIVVVLVVLGIILWDIISKGIGYISWDFLTQSPRDLGRAGGIFPALVGTLYLVIGAIAIALPLGLGAAVYLTEYTREGKITRMIRTGADLLNGTPSIVFGLFGFAFLVLYLNFGVSLIAGQITLALMVLPTIIRTAEEALKTVPSSVREGSLALGATKWQTIRRVVIPPAMPGIITGTILSIGRAAGETAPILFTAVVFSQRFLPTSLFEPVMALPYHLYILATNVPGAQGNQYATALVLLMLVIAIYSVAIVIRHHYQKTIAW
jgi:phosphate transport system permease protein